MNGPPDVEADLTGQGRGRRELPVGAEAAKKPEVDFPSIEAALEAEEVGFHLELIPAESGLSSDIGYGGLPSPADFRLADIDTRRQNFVFGQEVGRGEAQAAAQGMPADDLSGYPIGPAEQGPRPSHVAFAEQAPDTAAAHRTAGLHYGRNNAGLKGFGFLAVFTEGFDRPGAFPAEMKIPADQNHPGPQGLNQNRFQKAAGRQRRKTPAEGHDQHGFDSQFFDLGQPLGQSLDHEHPALAQDFFRMGGKGQEQGRKAAPPGLVNETAEDFSVPEVNSIKVAHGHGSGAYPGGCFLKPCEDLHPGLGLDDLSFVQIGRPELMQAGFQELPLFGRKVPLGPLLEKAEQVDEPHGQVQVFRVCLPNGVLHQAQGDQALGEEGQDQRAEIEQGEELLFVVFRRRRSVAAVLGLSVIGDHGIMQPHFTFAPREIQGRPKGRVLLREENSIEWKSRGEAGMTRVTQPGPEFSRLAEIIRTLRSESGCPWDREQDETTILNYLLEEVYEVVEAVQSGRPAAVCEELGDVLMEVVFLAQIYDEKGSFRLSESLESINSKMVRRHPHVFGGQKLETAQRVLEEWHRRKREEKSRASVLEGLPRTLPALAASFQVGQKVSSVGFDWEKAEGALAKLEEEFDELKKALREDDRAAVQREMGDLLFAAANVSRRAGINPEIALLQANGRFGERFAYVENRLREQGKDLAQAGLEEMDALWEEAKRKGIGL